MTNLFYSFVQSFAQFCEKAARVGLRVNKKKDAPNYVSSDYTGIVNGKFYLFGRSQDFDEGKYQQVAYGDDLGVSRSWKGEGPAPD